MGPSETCGYVDGVGLPSLRASHQLMRELVQIPILYSTDGSLSACATYTWPQLSAEAYFCATARTTATVVTETTSSGSLTSTLEPTIEPSRTDGGFSSTNAGGPQPTTTESDGGPNLGTESDLSSRQRIGAGVGSGLSGGLLLIFFA
ncbi:hypothetical protein FocTR4_00013139 [Fusarium oxysporum f. sp. cubense]|uniref:Uncharacterized protein n=2 Tax=Fusarium oxysporum species complex TaxID=171631 RepID=A0A5C6SKF9_FUSOC|nr:hypothetical protein FocTR4_00013139 [Fusarium oxysporum f. sp. cubense]